VMDMLVDLKDLSCDLSELITGLLELGKRIEMEVRVHLHSEKRRKRLAVLVSREPHCLRQFITDLHDGKLHGEVAAVLSNHGDLEGMAREAGLKFLWSPADDVQKHFDWLLDTLKEHA